MEKAALKKVWKMFNHLVIVMFESESALAHGDWTCFQSTLDCSTRAEHKFQHAFFAL